MMKKRLFSVLLALIMVLALVPAAAFASDIVDSGTCGAEGDGSNLTWTLDSNGTLIISGTGAMADYSYIFEEHYGDDAPWTKYDNLKVAVISEGVTRIGVNAFAYCIGLEKVTIPSSVTDIGSQAFSGCRNLKEIRYNAKAVATVSSAFGGVGTNCGGVSVIFGEKVKKIPAGMFRESYTNRRANIKKITFLGDAPTIGGDAFYYISFTAYYPYGNSTWTGNMMSSRYGNGYVKWLPYSTADIVSCETTGRTSYLLGDTFDTTGMGIVITHTDGCVETRNYDTNDIELSSYDMTKTGWQPITLTYEDITAKLNIYVHSTSTKTMDAKDYPESSHDYENNLDKTYTYFVPAALSMDVTFSSKTSAETNIDYIYVNDRQYTGTSLAGKTLHLTGDTLTIRLVTDGNDSDYGFSIDKIAALVVNHEPSVRTVVAPTYTAEGYDLHTFPCRDSYKDSYTDMKTLKQPTVTLSATATGINVKWDKIPGATGYQIWRKVGDSSSATWSLFKTITSGDTVSYTDGGRTNGTKYQYKVRAIAKVGYTLVNQGTFSSVKTKYFVTQPEINSAANTSTGINIKWSRVPGATGYKIYRKAGSSSTAEWKLIKTVTAGSTISYTDINRTNGTKYQYKIIAVRKVGSTNYLSAYSPVRTMYRLTRPTISSATNSGAGKITLKWNSNSKCSGYQVKYVKGDTIKTVKTTNLSRTLSDLTKGSTYKVYVRSYKTVGDYTYYSAYSGYKSVKITK